MYEYIDSKGIELDDDIVTKYLLAYLIKMEDCRFLKIYINKYENIDKNFLLKITVFKIRDSNLSLNDPFRRFTEIFFVFFCKHRFISKNIDQTEIDNFLNLFIQNGFQFSFDCLHEIRKLLQDTENTNIDYILNFLTENHSKKTNYMKYK